MNAFMRPESSHALDISVPKTIALLAAASPTPKMREAAGAGGATRYACACLVVVGVLMLLPAWLIAAVAAPLPAGLQSIFNTAPGVSAQPASAAQAASAPSPASQAELTRSLNTLIGTLENDTRREALVAQLKALRAATQGTAPVAAPALAQTNGTLLGAIASSIASVETNLNEGRTPQRFWAARFSAAAGELRTLLTGGRG